MLRSTLTRALAVLVATSALLASPASAGMYPSDGPVINLDAKGFKKVMASEHASMVAFVAPWCGHCKNLTPEFSKAAQSLHPLIPFYAIDCDAAPNKALCSEYSIKGFPTIKAFPKASKGPAREYQGERKSNALVTYASDMIPDKVRKLRIAKGEDAMALLTGSMAENPDVPHALLIHPSAPSIPLMWKVLASRLTPKLKLAFIKDTTDKTVLKALNLQEEGKDTVRVVTWSNGDMAAYQGPLKFEPLLKYLTAISEGSTPPQPIPTAEPKAAAEDAATKRARLQAKWEEEERRDAARRAKLASNAASAPEAVQQAEAVPGVKDAQDGAEEPQVPQAPGAEAGETEQVEETTAAGRSTDEL